VCCVHCNRTTCIVCNGNNIYNTKYTYIKLTTLDVADDNLEGFSETYKLDTGHPRPGFLYEFVLTTIGLKQLSSPPINQTVKIRK